MNTHTKSITTLVLGIVAAVSVFAGPLAFVGLICAIVGIVFGVQLKKELSPSDPDYNYANIGMILSIVGLILAGIGIACVIAGLAAVGAVASGMPVF